MLSEPGHRAEEERHACRVVHNGEHKGTGEVHLVLSHRCALFFYTSPRDRRRFGPVAADINDRLLRNLLHNTVRPPC